MKSLDTNILLRYILHDDRQQYEAAYRLLTHSGPNSFMVADAVFFEIVWILSGKTYRFERGLLAQALRRITDLPQINCNRRLLEKVLPIYEAHLQVSFLDSCLSVYAELNNAAPLLTFDKKLARALPDTIELVKAQTKMDNKHG